MKVFKTSELNRGKIFHIQDHDRHFHFIGRFRYCGLDFMQFDVLPMYEAPSCKTLGMYAFDIGSKFTLHGVTWDDKQQDYVADQWIVSSKDLEKDVDDVKKDAEDHHMKFDVKKAEDKLYQGKFHVQDHDNKFQFYGVFKSVKPDELTFYISGPTVGNTHTCGTYRFPAGSHFTIYTQRLNADKTEWIYSPGPGHIIDWKDITETDNDVEVDVKEDNDMKLDSWKDFVIKDDAWSINPIMKKGDRVYRFFNDKFDIKANMTINYLGYGMIGFHMEDTDTDIANMEIDESMRVCATHSPDDSGIPVRINNNKFNPELRVGKLYWVTDSNKNIPYMVHVKSITDNAIEVHIISTVKEHNNTSSLTVTGKEFGIAELLEYKFKEVNNGGK